MRTTEQECVDDLLNDQLFYFVCGAIRHIVTAMPHGTDYPYPIRNFAGF